MSDLTGKSVGQYRLESLLGRGGMADVYLARHEVNGRRVALKLVRLDEITDGDRRFLSEAQLLSNLDHPDIVHLYDFFESQGMFALAVEYVPGRGLDGVLEERKLTPAEALDMFEKIVRPIVYLHEIGIVHRDIKPSNIHVLPDGNIKLLDFGIARATNTKRLTRVGRVIGTPAYLSPEIRSGAEPMPTADVWSLGVLLREMIDGPAEGQIETKRLKVGPAFSNMSPEEKVARKVISHCLQRDLDHRYADAKALLRDLESQRLESSLAPLFSRKTLLIAGAVLAAIVVVWLLWPHGSPQRTAQDTASTGLAAPGQVTKVISTGTTSQGGLVPVTIESWGKQPADVYIDGTLSGKVGEQSAVIQLSVGDHTIELRSGDKKTSIQTSVSSSNNYFQMQLD